MGRLVENAEIQCHSSDDARRRQKRKAGRFGCRPKLGKMRDDVFRFWPDRSVEDRKEQAEPFRLCFQGLPGSSPPRKLPEKFSRIHGKSRPPVIVPVANGRRRIVRVIF